MIYRYEWINCEKYNKKMALNFGVIAVTMMCISNIGVGNGLITFAEEIGETGYYTIDGTSISKEEAEVLISKKENEIEEAEQRIKSFEERLKEETWI